MGSEPETFSDAYEIATDDLETLDHRELYRYRSSRVKELAFAHQAPSSLPRDVLEAKRTSFVVPTTKFRYVCGPLKASK